MSKMNELDMAIKELRSTANAISSVADTLTKMFSCDYQSELTTQATDNVNVSSNQIDSELSPTSNPTKILTLPEVRAILSEKARNGYRSEVKELLLKYGSDRLSGIEESRYAELVAEVEDWKDAK